MGGLLVVGIIVVAVTAAVLLSVRVVAQHERLVIVRMGRMDPDRVRGPGTAFLLPVLDRGVRVDMRPRVFELFGASLIAEDGKSGVADIAIRCHVVDAYAVTSNVANFDAALPSVALTAVREKAATMSMAELLAARARISEQVREKVADVAGRWGAELDDLEITDVRPVDPRR